jgi:CDP-glucose 4,6-dehydratase
MDLSFWKEKRVFITGHTGFKGAWLCKILTGQGAVVTGYALRPPKENLYDLCGLNDSLTSVVGDIRDYDLLFQTFQKAEPEIVFHLAAQPLVRLSYQQPVYTYETNVIGTAHVLECIRNSDCVRSFLNVTTDKVYQNNEWAWGYRETEVLCGYDPYSNSKSCSELVTQSYVNAFFANRSAAISTARSGNVIGGGDFSMDRIVPDFMKAASQGEILKVRNPRSTRPYQHVLEAIGAYLLIAEKQYEDPSLAGAYNVGPNDSDCVATGILADMLCDAWGNGARWENLQESGPHESGFLKLDCSKIKAVLGWKPVWTLQEAVTEAVSWYKAYYGKQDVLTATVSQIEKHFV